MEQQHKISEYVKPWTIPKNFGSVGRAINTTSRPQLFSPITIKDMTMKNRIAVSPMCQYSCNDGFMNDWHLVHLGAFAKGGAGLIILEATATSPEGRISYGDSGLWKDEQMEPLKRVIDFCKIFGPRMGIQIAHAGRKASTEPPFLGHRKQGIPFDDPKGWKVVGPSEVAWDENSQVPHELSISEIKTVINDFKNTARRALQCGFDFLEIHGAHGYLISSFLSPCSNKRTDEYGGDFNGRIKLLLDIVREVRTVWPSSKPLSVRLSCVEWVKDGWQLNDTVRLAKILENMDVDILDCSSGGNSSNQHIVGGPLYQMPFAQEVKNNTNKLYTMGVGLVNKAHEAESCIAENKCDIVAVGRAFLRDPYWPIHVANDLDCDVDVPLQYAFIDKRMMAHLHGKDIFDLKKPGNH
ncbi:hypothetical protein DICPUDRAFT_155555 [Dictyostelium purpureum]|uniref:NADH:flavin oxidoreductase/NADH oxidase N-terminal domain-containing protein n=1 Tax=Dictyostelium purpureum TaxID=5786 RepID=F0ZUB4_DICPU|nr:uncharacterized protein DICPUDRAFT_155555 [Dictyostelium purpureum]EGC32476.1 hypothetical protein DICPUDRAFT_155555 [Dictyostelium purpureum]|eukprot:XP_003291010.1 hypothetical protein DICPUDRAFT_155555 [Dictyostelium purpureum]